jgi:hypothetical protein
MSEPARIAGHNLVLDSITAEVVGALEVAGCFPILLKGPATARWLYEPGERWYIDVDLLVGPSHRSLAHQTLTKLGFQGDGLVDAADDRPTRRDRFGRGVPVDIHYTLNCLEHVPAESVWTVLEARTETLMVGGRLVRVLNPAGRAFNIALHALDHRGGDPQAQEDLRRAIARVPRSDWAEAASVAKELGAEPHLAAGLLTEPAGRDLVSALRLSTQEPWDRSLRRRSASTTSADLALGVDWWLRADARTKLRLVGRKLFPTPAYLRARSHLARRGPLGLIVGYVARPFVLTGRASRGLVTRALARRPGDGDT